MAEFTISLEVDKLIDEKLEKVKREIVNELRVIVHEEIELRKLMYPKESKSNDE